MHILSYEFLKISKRAKFVCKSLRTATSIPAGAEQINPGRDCSKIITLRKCLLNVQLLTDCGRVALHRGVKRCKSKLNLKHCLRGRNMIA